MTDEWQNVTGVLNGIPDQKFQRNLLCSRNEELNPSPRPHSPYLQFYSYISCCVSPSQWHFNISSNRYTKANWQISSNHSVTHIWQRIDRKVDSRLRVSTISWVTEAFSSIQNLRLFNSFFGGFIFILCLWLDWNTMRRSFVSSSSSTFGLSGGLSERLPERMVLNKKNLDMISDKMSDNNNNTNSNSLLWFTNLDVMSGYYRSSQPASERVWWWQGRGGRWWDISMSSNSGSSNSFQYKLRN